METTIYTNTGAKAGTFPLPDNMFNLPWNADLVHQVVVSMESNARAGTANTKNRGEVSGGGKKPWKQKGTGRARHGSTRSPLWVGGGISHGPRAEKNYTKKINRKMKTAAFLTVLSQKYRKGEVLFIDDMKVTDSKTREVAASVAALSGIKGFERLAGKRKTAVLALPARDDKTTRAARNLPQLSVEYTKDLNPVDLLNHRYLVIVNPSATLAVLASRVR